MDWPAASNTLSEDNCLLAQVIQRARKLWKGASDKADLLSRVEFVEGSFFESSAPRSLRSTSH